jgi:hypothetical protein
MLEVISRKGKSLYKKKLLGIFFIRKTKNANNMNSFKKLYIILMNISTMLKDVFRFSKGYSINNNLIIFIAYKTLLGIAIHT